MSEITVVYCPKCSSEDVKLERSEPLPVRVSMDALATYNPHQSVPFILFRDAAWRATCNQCGYWVNYQGY